MEPKHRVYFTALVTSAVFSGALMSTALMRLPVLWYFPLLHEWQLVARPEAFAGDWYGRSLFALEAAVVVGAATWFACGVLKSPKTERPFRWLALWTGLLFMFASGLYVYQLSQRVAPPEPLPQGYVPR
jgi:hypothetical protein